MLIASGVAHKSCKNVFPIRPHGQYWQLYCQYFRCNCMAHKVYGDV